MKQCLKIYIRNARTEIYKLIYYIDTHEKKKP